MLEILQHPIYGSTAIFIICACVGSFLNVVILRLPRMLQRDWRHQCRELLEIIGEEEKPFNLSFPASHCPVCEKPLRFWHNIPMISYLLLGAKCGWCKTTIPWRYPVIELITAVGSVHLALHFGIDWPLLAYLFLFWSLVCLTVIDLDHQLLPDNITLPLLWAGLLTNYFGLITSLESAVIGAMVGYLAFWIVFQVHYQLTGREGLGYGDFKLLAALGAWLGWEMLPMVVLASSLIGTLVAVALMLTKKLNRRAAVSFGPFLALGGWLALVWGQEITGEYLKLLRF